jgi:multiple sugar transport system ATP-binding protein
MRAEIKKLHQKLKTTMVYVTHDQVEAMTMGDRIVVMKDGVIHQIGSPTDIYKFPQDLFVAGFIGSPAMNFISGKIQNGVFTSDDSSLKLPLKNISDEDINNKSIILGIRPEEVSLNRSSPDDGVVSLKLEIIEPMGNETILTFTCGKYKITCRSYDSTITYETGSLIDVYFNLRKAHLFDRVSGKNIRWKDCHKE